MIHEVLLILQWDRQGGVRMYGVVRNVCHDRRICGGEGQLMAQ